MGILKQTRLLQFYSISFNFMGLKIHWIAYDAYDMKIGVWFEITHLIEAKASMIANKIK